MFPCSHDYFVKAWQVYPPNIVIFLNEGDKEADGSIQAVKEKVHPFCDVRNVKIDFKDDFSVQELICDIPKEDGFFGAAFILKKDSASLYVNMLTLASSHSTRIMILDEELKPLPPYPSLGLNSSQMDMLRILNDRGTIQKKELVSLADISQGYVSVSIGILVRQGLATRNQVRHDTFYSITLLGKRTFSILSSYAKR
jgi:DNA-binding MarR family transcriptional regulator